MIHENEIVGFSIALPDGWHRVGTAVLPEFPGTDVLEDEAHPSRRLSVRPTNVAGDLLEPNARGRELAIEVRARRLVVKTVSPASVGGELNAVVVEYEIAPAREGFAYSVVRDGLEYRLTFTAAAGELTRSDLDRLLASFRFPASDRAREVARTLARSLTAMEQAMLPSPTSPTAADAAAALGAPRAAPQRFAPWAPKRKGGT